MVISKAKITLAILVIAILATYFWLQPTRVGSETIFTGGTILTLETKSPVVEALLVRNGEIISTGTLQEAKEAATGSPNIIDLKGNTLMPGLIEPHTHPLATAMLGAAIDVSGFSNSNRTEVIASLKKGIKKGGNAGWIVAYGWDPVMLADLTAPTLTELDILSPDLPLVILTQMMHDAYANSAALSAAGITATSTAPLGGEFVKDVDGNLTGTIREIGAIGELFKALPSPPSGAHAFLLAQKYKQYAKAGYTTLGILGPVGRADNPIEIIKQVNSDANSPVRTVIYGLPDQIEDLAKPETSDVNAPVIGVKFWMDGSPFAGGAAFDGPYENTPLVTERLHLAVNHLGALNYDEEEFEALYSDYHKKGFQIAVHVQGERAVERVLDVAEKTLRQHPRADHRHRLEHNALITKGQLARAQKLGLTTSFFIDHLYYYGHALPDLVGDRTQRYMPVKSALDTGHRATVHTDNPGTPIGALRAMQTLRMRTSRADGSVLGADQKLTPQEALETMTINAAWQLGMEDQVGSLKLGKLADLVILSANPLTTPDKDLQEIKVIETWRGGQPVDTRTVNSASVSLGWGILRQMLTGN